MTDKTMTEVRDWHLEAYKVTGQPKHKDMADAITRHLSQTAERGEAVVLMTVSDEVIPVLQPLEGWRDLPFGNYLLYTAPPPAAGVPDGWAMVPEYRGYAHLGIGRYRLFHSHADDVPELCIVPAKPEEVAGRIVGDLRNDGPDVIDADAIAVRLQFENVAGLNALEQQLRLLREVHFPGSLSATPSPAIDVAAVREVIGDLREWGENDEQLMNRAKWLSIAIGDAK